MDNTRHEETVPTVGDHITMTRTEDRLDVRVTVLLPPQPEEITINIVRAENAGE